MLTGLDLLKNSVRSTHLNPRVLLDSQLVIRALEPLRVFNTRLLSRRLSKALNLEECVDALNFGGFPPRLFKIQLNQVRSEILQLAKILEERHPESICEIGTGRAGTLLLWMRIADPTAMIASIDLPGGMFGGGYRLHRARYYQGLAGSKQHLSLLRGDSHSLETFQSLQKILGPRKLDFLFIDGDHTYEGVKLDFERYANLVADEGLIALHDIADAIDSRVGVSRFWNEISKGFESTELIENPKQGWGGIGLVEFTARD
jgi:cephalosporin hydroxylase